MGIGQKERDRAKFHYKLNNDGKYPPCYDCKDYSGEVRYIGKFCTNKDYSGGYAAKTCPKLLQWARGEVIYVPKTKN